MAEIEQVEFVDYGDFGVGFKYTYSSLVHIEADISDLNDIRLLLSLNHENVLKYISIVHDHILLEYADCGSLKQLLHGDEQREYSFRNALEWMYQAAKGLEYLHSRQFSETAFYSLTSNCLLLTNNYRYLKIIVLPQQLSLHGREKSIEELHFRESNDILEIGITIWELLTRKKPFYHTNSKSKEIYEAFSRGKCPSVNDIKISIDNILKSLIENCWHPCPEEKPSIQDVISTLNAILTQKEDTELNQVLKANIGAIIDFTDIELYESIRDSHFSVSYKALWLDEQISVTKFINMPEQWTQLQSFVEEIRKNIKLNHKFVVNIYGVSIYKESTYLISEYSDCGSLSDYLYGEEQRTYSVYTAFSWMIDAAKGVAFLNRKLQLNNIFMNYILTPHNMILFNNYTRLKISDYCCPFDVATMLSSTSEIAYIAPEVFGNKKTNYQSDIYSLGIILWEVLARKKPYYDLITVPPHNLLKIIKVTGMRPALSDIKYLELEAIEEFIEASWHWDRLERPHPYFWLIGLETYRSYTNNNMLIRFYKDVSYEDVKLIEIIGCGGFGIVYKAKWNSNVVAVKKSKKIDTSFQQEVKQLSRTKHENIIKLYGSCFHKDTAYLVMDYAECGSLYKYLHGNEQKEYTMAMALDWMTQCIQGINHLHSMEPKPLIHRDIKTQNLLLTKNYKQLKIGDFGTATDLRSIMTSERGTAAYIAPEVLEGIKYTEKCDIYSFGIVLWELMARMKPFHHLENPIAPAIILKTVNGERPSLDDLIPNCEELRILIVNCWHQDPEMRLAVNQIQLANIPCVDILIHSKDNQLFS